MKRNEGLLAILKYPEYMKLWIGSLISRVGDSIDSIAFMWMVYKLTGSGLMMGTIMAVNFMPHLLFGMVAGVLVDRWPKKPVLMISNLGRASLVALTAALFWTGNLQVWYLYVITFLNSTLETFERPARSAVMPSMISDKADLLAANGLGHASSSLAEMLGLALGGVIVAKLGIPAALFADSFSFLFYAAAIVFAVIPATKAGAPGQPVAHHFWSEFRGGLREAFGNNMVRLAIIMGLFLNFMVSPYNIIAPIYADKVLAAGAGGYAIMETAITAAMMLGALVVGQFSRRLSYRAILITGTALIGVGFGLMAVLPNLPIALISSALLGIGSGSLNTAVGGMFVTQCPQELIGRVSSVAGSLMMAAMPAATAVAGTAADLVPATGIFAGIGVMVLVVAAALSFSKALRAQARANQPESNAA